MVQKSTPVEVSSIAMQIYVTERKEESTYNAICYPSMVQKTRDPVKRGESTHSSLVGIHHNNLSNAQIFKSNGFNFQQLPTTFDFFNVQLSDEEGIRRSVYQ